jgi:hypothetical protein
MQAVPRITRSFRKGKDAISEWANQTSKNAHSVLCLEVFEVYF